MTDLISVENMRLSDAATIKGGISSLELMRRAAMGIYMSHSWEGSTAIVVGSGNNGGDGFALAEILKGNGKDVTIITVTDHYSDDSSYYRDRAQVKELDYEGGCILSGNFDTVVDCLLGTGFVGTPRGNYLNAINELNTCKSVVISADIPSGLNGDSGLCEVAVKADKTVTIGVIKLGLIRQEASEYVGELVLARIGINPIKAEDVIYTSSEWPYDTSMTKMSEGEHTAYKYDYSEVIPNRKAVFFDIDGTLWDRTNYIPESTRKAIDLLKANGHKVLINTGRSIAYVTNEDLLSLGFDGLVTGCGTRIEINGEVYLNKLIPTELMNETLKSIHDSGFRAILEGPKFLYLDFEDFGDDPYGKKLFSELGDQAKPIRTNRDEIICSKFACDMTGGNKEKGYAFLRKHYSIHEHNEFIAEFVPIGFSKGTGIAKACEIMGIDIRDSIAIGDGANDLDMFNASGLAIAMGNGSDKAKAAADYITTDLHDDGIYNALKHFMLI